MNEEKTRNVVVDFIRAYKNKASNESNLQWLEKQFSKYPELWKNEAERKKDANSIVSTIEKFHADKNEFDKHLASGKSHESYLINKIDTAATAYGVSNTSSYLASIDQALYDANKNVAESLYCRNPDGSIDFTRINQNPNLDGFVAEAHHAGTFNIDAAVKESGLNAKVLDSTAKNSVDLQIYDSSGKVLKRYQSKYGKDAEATTSYFEKGDYRGQRKLGPEEQVEQIPGSTDYMEADGIRSQSLSKEEAKHIQKRAQEEAQIKRYNWDDSNKVMITKSIGKKAALAGVLAVGYQGARIAGRRIWNWISGKENQTVEEDLQEFASSSLQSAGGAGIAVAATGGITVAVKSGWLGKVLQGTPVGHIANAVCLGIENVKVLWKFGKGEITGKEAFDQAGNATYSLVGGLYGAGKGAALGGTVGSILGPVGTVIGGVAGGIIGSIAGSTVGQAVYSGAKKIASGIGRAAKAAWSGVKSFARGLASIFS